MEAAWTTDLTVATMWINTQNQNPDLPLNYDSRKRYLCVMPYGMDFAIYTEFDQWIDDEGNRLKSVLYWMALPITCGSEDHPVVIS